MKLFGLVIGRATIIRDRAFDAVLAALVDPESSLRQAVVRVARGVVKDHIGEWFEAERERFEQLSMFEDFARQQREHDLAEAEKAEPMTVARVLGALPEHMIQLRYGILGLVVEHGVQFTATIGDAFGGWTPAEINAALTGLVSDGLLEVKHGVYSATLAGVGLGGEQKEARNEDPDSQ